MYPELFRIGDFSISTFGVMLAAAFLVGTWITARRMAEEGLDPEKATVILIYVMAGGIAGSKLYFAADVSLREGISFTSLLFARDGITWYGGLVLATVVGAIGCRRNGIPVKTFADCTAVAGAVGQAIGRVGCFLVGDDYGAPTDLPWGVAFPRGAPPTLEPVHPTQLYEIAWLLCVAALLWRRRRRSPFLFGEYIALNGLGRMVIEIWRVNPKVALDLTEPQWIGGGLVVLGVTGWLYYWSRTERAVS
ncbi:MAG: prolipoprotein diacylglyceryl transferase [Myxococcales bacterium]|nr:prolipoprotein diacylglyceryl transferase [Myxococcales bacterium]